LWSCKYIYVWDKKKISLKTLSFYINYNEFNNKNKYMWKKKKINKIIVWIFLWTAVWWLWFFSKTKKWKSFFNKITDDVKLWINEMEKTFEKLTKKDVKKKK